MQFLDNLKPLGLLVLRLALGASFIFHGYPKLTDPEHALKAISGYGGHFPVTSLHTFPECWNCLAADC